MIIVIGMLEPLVDPFTNKLELYNNFSIILLVYCLLLFTDFVPDALARYKIGYVMIFLTSQNIIVNLIFIGKDPIRHLFLRYKRHKLIKKYKKNTSLKTQAKIKFSCEALTNSIKTFKSQLLEEENLATLSEEDNQEFETERDHSASVIL